MLNTTRGKNKRSGTRSVRHEDQKQHKNSGTGVTLTGNGNGPKGKGKNGDKGKGKSRQEKRFDPSDGNGPFTLASFKKFHGDEKGQELWDMAEPGETMEF